MRVTVYDDQALPARDRLARWRAEVGRSLVANDIQVDGVERFRASMRLLDLGAVQVSRLSMTDIRYHRSPRLIRAADPEHLCAGFVLGGRQAISQHGRDAVVRTHDMVLYDTSHPHHGWTSGDGDPVHTLVVQMPRSLLTLPAQRVHDITAVPLATHQGVAALLVQFLLRLLREADTCRPADGPRLATALVDLLSATLAHELDAVRDLPPESHPQALALSVQGFVQRNLGDPDLSPGTVAAAHRISVRQLHRLFAREDTTIGAWIRRERLERCRRDLADPSLASRTIHAVAARWGFRRPADFTRAFRAAYGMPPSEYRALARVPGGGGPGTFRREAGTGR